MIAKTPNSSRERSTPAPRSRARLVYLILAVIAYAFIARLVFDYRVCWQSWDYPESYYPRIIVNGPRLVLDDLRRIFDIGPAGMLRNPYRFRYIQNYALVLDGKFRTWIFNYVVPHPTLSLTWVTTLIFAPLLFYKFLRELTSDRQAALIGLVLMLFSTGYLSHLTLLCNPGKPLMTTLMCACLYLGAKLRAAARPPAPLTGRAVALAVLLALAIYAAVFTDGEGVFVLVAIPVFFSGILRNRNFRSFMVGLSLAVVLLIAATLLYGAPRLIALASPGSPEIRIIVGNGDGPDNPFSRYILDWYNPRYVILTARNLLSSQSVFRGRRWTALIYLLILPYLIGRYAGLDDEKKNIVRRGFAVLILFIIFQSFGMASVLHQEGHILEFPFYYGALLSVFLPIVLAVPLSNEKPRFSVVANRIIVCFIALVMAANFIHINREVRNMYGAFSDFGHLERSVAVKAFSLRDSPAAIAELRAGFPLRSPWSYIQEIEVTARENLRRDLIRGVR